MNFEFIGIVKNGLYSRYEKKNSIVCQNDKENFCENSFVIEYSTHFLYEDEYFIFETINSNCSIKICENL